MADEFYQHEDDVLDYTFDWSKWLESTGDTITDSEFISDPTGLTLTLPSETAKTTTTWVAGGTDQANYKLFNKVTTVGGRTRTECIWIRIRNDRL